ncbi:hypothetical protein [Bartonella tribocorum]|uniref:Uncharacterized protein n=1 Tax=Bartonella tribocorum TaxID=85701 RepID=A0A2N9Y8Q1_9HYPH|nr:hypothetical protein [Bartonella tribocorum]PIT68084.1 hypothetical protein CEV08_08625 [Bartonella tribocorum]
MKDKRGREFFALRILMKTKQRSQNVSKVRINKIKLLVLKECGLQKGADESASKNVEHKISNEKSSLKRWVVNFLAHGVVWLMGLFCDLLKVLVDACCAPYKGQREIGKN